MGSAKRFIENSMRRQVRARWRECPSILPFLLAPIWSVDELAYRDRPAALKRRIAEKEIFEDGYPVHPFVDMLISYLMRIIIAIIIHIGRSTKR